MKIQKCAARDRRRLSYVEEMEERERNRFGEMLGER